MTCTDDSHPNLTTMREHTHHDAPRASVPSSRNRRIITRLRPCLAYLSLWDEIDDARYRLACRCIPDTQQPLSWEDFSGLLVAERVATWVRQGESVRLSARWVIDTQPLVDAWGGTEAVHRHLLDAWEGEPVAELVDEAVFWARNGHSWEALNHCWHLIDSTDGLRRHPRAQEVFADIPLTARKQFPELTWAHAAAKACVEEPPAQLNTLKRTLARDGLSIHADWESHPDNNSAISAGIIWMMSQRLQPMASPTQALDDAWDTQTAMSHFLHQHREAEHEWDPGVVSSFHTASAELAFARGDTSVAVRECDYALTLQPTDTGSLMPRVLKSFALELTGSGSQLKSVPTEDRIDPTPVMNTCPWGQAAYAENLRRCILSLRALRSLDEAASAEMITLRASDSLAGTPGWSMGVAMDAYHAALWGDPHVGLNAMDAAIAHHSVGSVEHVEPLGRTALARSRVLLLNRLGAYEAARQTLQSVPAPRRWTSLAHTALCEGDVDSAIRAADAGLYQSSTWFSERAQLAALRAAALAVDDSASREERQAAAVLAVNNCVTYRAYFPLGSINHVFREALLRIYDEAVCESGHAVADTAPLTARLSTLQDGTHDPLMGIRLTRREKVLLPMLATEDSVPEIAAQLHVSPNTVRKQVVTLRAKFHARNRADLVKRARDRGLVAI